MSAPVAGSSTALAVASYPTASEVFSGGWRLSKGLSRKKMGAAMAAHIAVQERGREPATEPRVLLLN